MLGGPDTPIQFLVPNRFTMGYGLTPEVVELAAQQNPKPKYLIAMTVTDIVDLTPPPLR